MPVGTAVITNINAIVDQRAPDHRSPGETQRVNVELAHIAFPHHAQRRPALHAIEQWGRVTVTGRIGCPKLDEALREVVKDPLRSG